MELEKISIETNKLPIYFDSFSFSFLFRSLRALTTSESRLCFNNFPWKDVDLKNESRIFMVVATTLLIKRYVMIENAKIRSNFQVCKCVEVTIVTIEQ